MSELRPRRTREEMDVSLYGPEHVRAYRETNGERGYVWNGTHILLLTTEGRASGQERTTPLIFIEDGDNPVIVASKAAAEKLGTQPLGEIVGYGQVAGPDPSLLTQPSRAIKAAAERAGTSVSDISLFELNEAFAAVGLASMADLGVSDDVVNVNGGAIALGHPVGMSGTRVALTLLHELKRRGGGLGAAALCGGGGQGDAILLQV